MRCGAASRTKTNKQLFHTVGNIDLITFKQPRLAVQGHLCGLVSQHVLDDFDVSPRLDGEWGSCVPQAMNPFVSRCPAQQP